MMQPMEDREFDKFFRDKLQQAEFQPSDSTWAKIASEINGRESVKKGYSIFLMAAASVICIVAASLWFYRSPNVIELRSAPEKIAKSQEIIETGETSRSLPSQDKDVASPNLSSLTVVRERLMSGSENFSVEANKVTGVQEIQTESGAEESKSETPEPELPVKAVMAPSFVGIDPQDSNISEVSVVRSTLVSAISDDEGPAVPDRKKINSIGSLVNFVVSKIDHREDKVIEFVDGEEGSEVSGINLGLVKLKRRIK